MGFAIVVGCVSSFFAILGLNLLFKPKTASEFAGSIILGIVLGLITAFSLGLLS